MRVREQACSLLTQHVFLPRYGDILLYFFNDTLQHIRFSKVHLNHFGCRVLKLVI